MPKIETNRRDERAGEGGRHVAGETRITELDTADFSDGMYILEIKDGQSVNCTMLTEGEAGIIVRSRVQRLMAKQAIAEPSITPLKPCPFCSSPAMRVGGRPVYITCGNPRCFVQAQVKIDNDCPEFWNTRKP